MWLPNLIFLLLAIWIFRRVEREKPIFSEWLQNRIADFFSALLSPVIKKLKQFSDRLLRWRPGHKEEEGTIYYPENMIIHANAEERVFHFPGCKYYSCKQCTIKFKDADVALAAGFEPCSQCRKKLNSTQ
jgi:lipopolysaccharide export system permease protein